MMRRAAVAAILALAGCATSPPQVQRDSCDATGAAAFAGKPADEATLADLRRATGTQTSRIVRPNMIVTTEYRFGRLSVDVDAANLIVRATCG